MKVQADKIDGVYAVKLFSDEAEIMSEELFLRCLGSDTEGTIGADLSAEAVERVIREYGIASRAGGEHDLTLKAAASLSLATPLETVSHA